MNENLIIGAAREDVGKVEWAVGDAIGSKETQADGVTDRMAGVFEHGYGVARDAANDAVDAAPARIRQIGERGSELGRRADAGIRNSLGDNGTIYLLAAAVGLVGLGLFAFARSNGSRSRSARPRRRNRVGAGERKTRTASTRGRSAKPTAA